MDSIELLGQTVGHFGDKCLVSVSTGDVYTGIYRGYGESTKESPLAFRLQISKSEASRIGVPSDLSEIGVRYDVISSIEFL